VDDMKELKDFILIYDKVLPEDVCKASVEDLENRSWEQHLFYESKTNTYAETIDDCDIYSEQIVTGQIIAQATGAVLHDYVKKLNSNYFNELQKFSNITYHRYRDGKQMVEHCDHIHALFKGSADKGIPILSVVGVLNDGYVGGEFVMFDDYEIKLGAGDIIVFPSVFLFPHRINRVTEGTRYSFVSWAW
jgi:predicted 2-oxoglutarate/Fe(II)-dependent dioxygenase YbiX